MKIVIKSFAAAATKSLAAAAVAAAAIGLVAMVAAFVVTGTASAQQPDPTPPAQTKREAIRADFFAKVAENLHVTVDQLKSAIKDAEVQTVDDMQATGTITPDQAAKLKDRINNSKGLALRGLFAPPRAKRALAVRREIVTSAAAAIGIAPKDLRTELQAGKSIADVAGEHSVSIDSVKSQITADAKAKLDQAVSKGRLTQDKEDAALKKLDDSLDDILNKRRTQ